MESTKSIIIKKDISIKEFKTPVEELKDINKRIDKKMMSLEIDSLLSVNQTKTYQEKQKYCVIGF
jgi:hypothetical protein